MPIMGSLYLLRHLLINHKDDKMEDVCDIVKPKWRIGHDTCNRYGQFQYKDWYCKGY